MKPMTNKRVLITGASGLVGRECLTAFRRDPQWSCLGLAFSRAGDHLRKCDLTDLEQVSAVVREFKPSVILHSAAERRPDVVENDDDKTSGLNLKATQYLCQLANEIGAYVFFVSTDYVFDGKNPPYVPDAKPNPLNKYAVSKLEGEKIVMAANPGNIIMRISVVYGPVESLEESAVTVLFTKVKDTTKPAVMNNCERRYPSSSTDLGNSFKALIDQRTSNPELTGIFHCTGNEVMTKYKMALTMAELFGICTDHIVADEKPTGGTMRPYDCQLDCSRMEKIGATCRTPFKEGIKKALEKFYP